MEIAQPSNEQVLAYLGRAKREAPVHAPWHPGPEGYFRCGCHPDIVERLWEQLGATLPTGSRCFILGVPTLIQPESGVILAIGIGTQYGLRLPGALGAEAIKAGAATQTTWSTGDEMDTRHELGPDWVFGAWLAGEPGWVRQVCVQFAPKV
jgi:hypothetical protein